MAIEIRSNDGIIEAFHDLQPDEDAPIVISSLRAAAARAGVAVCTLHERDLDRTQSYDRGKSDAHSAARSGLIEYFRDVQGDITGLNDILDHLGYDKYAAKWLVTVNVEGTPVLKVIVEADDESDAEDIVSANVSQYTDTVDVSFSYDGEGEVDEENEYEYEIGNLFDFLQVDYDVEEYEG